MEKSLTCKMADGREVVIRVPDAEADLERLSQFFAHLPEEVKNCLRYNAHDRSILKARLQQQDNTNHWRLIAVLNGRIIADATMDREPYGWTRHIAEFRAVVDPQYENLGLRMLLCDQLINWARNGGVERLTAEVLVEQQNVIDTLTTLGFSYDIIRKNYAKGVDGKLHDVVVMSNDLEAVWRQLEEHLADLDSNFAGFSGQM